MKPFNRFPQDFTALKAGRPSSYRLSRAIWDGDLLRIFREKDGTIEKVYEAAVTNFISCTQTGARWVDPASGVQFSMIKSSGCSCKYKDLALYRTADPETP